MTTAVTHQKVNKRPHKKRYQPKKVNRKNTFVPAAQERKAVNRRAWKFRRRLKLKNSSFLSPVCGFSMKLYDRLRSIKRLPFYAVGVLSLLIIILFLTSSVPGEGMTAHASLQLPDAEIVQTLLYSYTVSEEERPEQDLRHPQPGILSAVKPVTYKVKSGDTLSEIAAKNDVELGTLISFNNIKDVRRIKVGTNLKIPEIDGVLYRVKSGDSLSVIAHRHAISLNDILDANGLESSIIRVGQELFIPGAAISDFELKKATGMLFLMPTTGKLTSPYGMRTDPFTGVWRMHYGIDIANIIGTSVKASMGGVVGAVGTNPKGYGRYIIINHPGGFQSLYAHLFSSYVVKGDRVYQGQTIGEMGNSGRSTGPHLHFSIYQYQKPVNPDKYLF